jgi:hypothetical protein
MITNFRSISLVSLILVTALLCFTACKKKIKGCTDPNALNYNPDAEESDGNCQYPVDTTILFNVSDNGSSATVEGFTNGNFTFTSNKQWILKGFVYVKSGATLTIEPGTIIRGDKNSKGTLIIERGAKIDAQGTSTSPIVFTSNQSPGNRNFGDWGGVIICGKAKTNLPGGEGLIEGGTGAYYGGQDDNDNSGILQFVRIEFAGIPFQPNQEINGLTLGSVGKATTIDHIQVSYCGDDSFEWFGGNVNAKYLVALATWDDDFDTDQGYSGNLQFLFAKRDPLIADASGSNGFESDNNADGTEYLPYTNAVISNATILGPIQQIGDNYNSQFLYGIHCRRNTHQRIYNSVITGFPYGLYIQNSITEQNAIDNDLAISDVVLAACEDTVKKDQFSSFALLNWFKTPSFNNQYYPTVSSLQLVSPFALIPQATLSAGSPLATNANFSYTQLDNSFFETVPFKGAFGTTDWTLGWTNWDPQTTVY